MKNKTDIHIETTKKNMLTQNHLTYLNNSQFTTLSNTHFGIHCTHHSLDSPVNFLRPDNARRRLCAGVPRFAVRRRWRQRHHHRRRVGAVHVVALRDLYGIEDVIYVYTIEERVCHLAGLSANSA